MTYRVLGIDPGTHGGCAIVDINDGTIPQLIAAIDVPTVGVGAKERVDAIALQEWILEYGPEAAFIERGQAMPRQGASSGFKYGRAVGALEAVVAVCTIATEILEPSMWKRALRLRGKDKEGARQYALQLFPHAHHLLARRKDHQRAEAALIGYAGVLMRTKSVVPLPMAPAPSPTEEGVA
jgi:crossover junction endodeoxyribonuclease RuvC